MVKRSKIRKLATLICDVFWCALVGALLISWGVFMLGMLWRAAISIIK